MKRITKAYINELINSGITLNERETKIVEDNLERYNRYSYPYGYMSDVES